MIKKNDLDIHKVQQEIADYLRDTFPVITSIFTRDYLETQVSSRNQQNFLLNGFNPSLTGIFSAPVTQTCSAGLTSTSSVNCLLK